MKQRILILEGPDGVGKTFLKDSLVHMDPNLYVPCSLSNDSPEIQITSAEEGYPVALQLLKTYDKSKVLVFDRFLLSDIVYNSVLRNQHPFKYSPLLKDLCENFDVLFVLLTRPIPDTDFEDDKLNITKKEFEDIIDRYRDLKQFLSFYSQTWSFNLFDNRGYFFGERKDDVAKMINKSYTHRDLTLRDIYTHPWQLLCLSMFLQEIPFENIVKSFLPWFSSTSFVDTAIVNFREFEYLFTGIGSHLENHESILRFLHHLRSRKISNQHVLSTKEILSMPGCDEFSVDCYDVCVRRFYKKSYLHPLLRKQIESDMEDK